MSVPTSDEVVILVVPVKAQANEVARVAISRADWDAFEYDVERGRPQRTDVQQRINDARASFTRPTFVRVLQHGRRIRNTRKVA